MKKSKQVKLNRIDNCNGYGITYAMPIKSGHYNARMTIEKEQKDANRRLEIIRDLDNASNRIFQPIMKG